MLLTIVRNARGRHHVHVKHDSADDRARYIINVRKFLPAGFTFHTKIAAHVCARNAIEVALSDCAFGCKIFRCRMCNTRATLHNRIYGCRHQQAR